MSELGAETREQRYHEEMEQDQTRRSIRSIPELKQESARIELAALKLLDTLNADARPSFAIPVYLPLDSEGDQPLELIYYNAAFSKSNGLSDVVTGPHNPVNVFVESSSPEMAFRKWLRGVVDSHDSARRTNAYVFDGFIWTATVVEDYKIVSGIHTSLLWADGVPDKNCEHSIDPRERKAPRNMPKQGRPPHIPPAMPSQESSGDGTSELLQAGKYGPYDFTLPNAPPSILTEHVKLFRSVDWAQTSIGSMDTWPAELRSVVNMALNDIQPTVLFWGHDMIMLYNEAYIQLIGLMHPCIGKSARQAAIEYWHTFQPLVDHINATGQSVSDDEIPVFIDRHGFLEETYWSFQFIPVLDSKGFIAGYYHPLFETTKHHLLERRVSCLVELGSQTAKARTLQSYWDLALHTLTLNDKDVPFALLYSADSQSMSDVGSISSPGSIPPIDKYSFKGSIGVDANHSIAPLLIDLKEGLHLFQRYLIQASKSRKVTVVHLEELGLSRPELADIHWKGYGDPCRTIVICPILPTTGEQVEGFLILGNNPRIPFDDDYQQFVHVMLRLLATSLASVVLFDEEVRQKEKAIGQAAVLQEQLLAELQMREKKFQRFAERSDVAIFILDPLGNFTYRNQRWYEIFEVAAGNDDAMSAWLRIAYPEDLPFVESVFARLVVHHEPVVLELKTRMAWMPPAELSQPEYETADHNRWILCSAYPELGPNGELIEIVGNITDISRQKWAEGIQKLRTDSALESKKHLEHFIDTTSHEMRNPLSAIIHCADGILSSYSTDEQEPPTPRVWSSFLEQTIDAAQTIAQCAQHMRHIVDDILTISKLDSGLLVITAVDAQPESIMKHVVKMFEGEARAAKVELSFVVDHSYRDMRVDWVSLDPTRVLQILINLLTNAIKFTRLEDTRRVTIVLAASSTPPESVPDGIRFNEEKLVGDDRHLQDDWKQDTHLFYLQFSVTDTGRGLTEEERGVLFNRFSQASPRTHIHYGGSGLGLFISRRLTELQGGAIGLSSQPKKGSTFSFYIKTRHIKFAMLRKNSLPNVLPEDIRHRAETPLINMSRPLLPLRIPSNRSNSGLQSEPPSPSLRRQATSHHREVSGSSPTVNSKELPNTETLHVLVVEDNLINQRVLAKQLRNLGCIVDVANHGREALDFLQRTVYWNREHPAAYHIPSTEPLSLVISNENDAPLDLHVILMDWEMPIMSGLVAVEKIRQMERAGQLKGRVPVIGVTANVRQQQIETAMAAGMDDVVGKPFRVADLLVRMRSIVDGLVGGVEDRR